MTSLRTQSHVVFRPQEHGMPPTMMSRQQTMAPHTAMSVVVHI
jgi:hypothetical protein